MNHGIDVLKERGLIHQATGHDDRAIDECESFYLGLDPTAPSLHVGHLVPIMAARHLERAGCKPIVVVGGYTALIGDLSGKKGERAIPTSNELINNTLPVMNCVRRLLNVEDDKAGIRVSDIFEGVPPPSGPLLNNRYWLGDLNLISFLIEYGRHFSVNRMLANECFKARYEGAGLSFRELSYQLLQAYDYLYLLRGYGCTLQIGGSDQWANILAGVDLIRRVEGAEVHGLTTPLLLNPDGTKMGKTEKGAVWLDPEKTSPYDYFQFWVNTPDEKVGQYLRLFTELDLTTIEALDLLEGQEINRAKAVLAIEATAIVHGREEAAKATEAARAAFGDGDVADVEMPTHPVAAARFEDGIPAGILAAEGGLCGSKNEARRLAEQGGLYLNGRRVSAAELVTEGDLDDEMCLVMRAGKKRHLRVEAIRPCVSPWS